MAEHTKGRVTVHRYRVMQGDNQIAIAHGQTFTTSLENARRLAACWNALQRYSTEMIEHGDVTLRDPDGRVL